VRQYVDELVDVRADKISKNLSCGGKLAKVAEMKNVWQKLRGMNKVCRRR
jgi:hypothetical protein